MIPSKMPGRWLTAVDSLYSWCLQHDEITGDAMVSDGDPSLLERRKIAAGHMTCFSGNLLNRRI